MLAKIRTEEAPEVDAFEAQKVIRAVGQLRRGRRGAGRRRLSGYTPCAGRLYHAPPQDAVRERREPIPAWLRACARPAVQPQELTVKCAGPATSRRSSSKHRRLHGRVPIIHQAIAVRAAIDALDACLPGGPRGKFLAGEWPDEPSLRYLDPLGAPARRAVRTRCCARTRPKVAAATTAPRQLDAAQAPKPDCCPTRSRSARGTEASASHIGLDDIRADEFFAHADPGRRARPVGSRAGRHPWQITTNSSWSSPSRSTKRTSPSRASTRTCRASKPPPPSPPERLRQASTA